MAFSSRRRNYLLTPHRKDGLIDWMKSMLNHSFVLDALEATAADTFSHFEDLIEEHRCHSQSDSSLNANPSRLKQLVPTVGTFHTHLPLRKAFMAYNKKYALTKRKFVTISFNELRHIMNLAQIMALRGVGVDTDDDEAALDVSLKQWENSPAIFRHHADVLGAPSLPPDMTLGDAAVVVPVAAAGEDLKDSLELDATSVPVVFKGPKMITFDGDQTLYSDGKNFEHNPQLANYLYLLLRHGVTLAVVTAAGYEYATEKYEMRLSGLLAYFKAKNLPEADCERFYLFGGECNFLLKLGSDYKLHPVKEDGPGGWHTETKEKIPDSPANWDETDIQSLLDVAETSVTRAMKDLKIRGSILRKKRSVGLYPATNRPIPREALDETVLRVQQKLHEHASVTLPFCAFNGGTDVWIDVGNKCVGVNILASYLDIDYKQAMHVGDQFLNTGNDYAARGYCPCIWITNPDETTYILKSILRLAGVPLDSFPEDEDDESEDESEREQLADNEDEAVDFSTVIQRHSMINLDGLSTLQHYLNNQGPTHEVQVESTVDL